MNPFAHMGPELFDRPWWWGLGWFLPLVLVAALTGLVVWAVVRSSRPVAAGAPASGPPAAPPPATAVAAVGQAPGERPAGIDPALKAARLRYARGEMGRDEFVRVSRDLGFPVPTADAEEGDRDA